MTGSWEDVTVRNFVGGKLNIMHNSDVDPRGVINAGIADMVKKYASPSRTERLADAWRSSSTRVAGMSKDVSDLIYRLARKRTERVLGPASRRATTTRTRNSYKNTTCTRQARREGCKAPSRRLVGQGPSGT